MDLLKFSGIKSFLRNIFSFRKLLMPSFTHIFDTATDVALVLEWYNLSQCQKNDPTYLEGMNIKIYFYISLSIMIYYRIASSIVIYNFSKMVSDVFIQFVFDFYLFKIIYYNLYRFHSFEAHAIIHIVRGLEGSTESIFQSVLTLVYMIELYKINSDIDILALVSFLFSTNTFIPTQ